MGHTEGKACKCAGAPQEYKHTYTHKIVIYIYNIHTVNKDKITNKSRKLQNRHIQLYRHKITTKESVGGQIKIV